MTHPDQYDRFQDKYGDMFTAQREETIFYDSYRGVSFDDYDEYLERENTVEAILCSGLSTHEYINNYIK